MFKNSNKSCPNFTFAILITAVWSIIIFLAIGWSNGSGPKAPIGQLLKSFYLPHYNNCILRPIEGIPMGIYIYGIIIASTLSLFIMKAITSKEPFFRLLITALKHTTYATLCIVFILQTFNQAIYLAHEYKTYADKPVSERCPGWLASAHTSGAFFRKILPEARSAQFISDLDITQEFGMILYGATAYHLYPIDIRNIRQEPSDTIIVTEKKKPLESIPGNYKIIGNINARHFLAVKKDDL